MENIELTFSELLDKYGDIISPDVIMVIYQAGARSREKMYEEIIEKRSK